MQTIPIYIINLRRTPERRLQIQRQLDACGLEYRFIEAVDTYDLNADELNGLSLRDGVNALACTLSHIKCYDEIIKNKHPIACILEDDAELLPSFPDVLSSKKLQNKNWEILLLAHHTCINHFLHLYYKFMPAAFLKNRLRLYDSTTLGAIPGNFSRKIHERHYIANLKRSTPAERTLWAGCYLVRLPAAKNLREIAYVNRKSISIDNIIGQADLFGMSLKLITPPCIKLSLIYLKYSVINVNNIRQYKNLEIDTRPFPDQELLHRFMRNKWSSLVILMIRYLLNRYRRKFALRLLQALVSLELRNGINYFRPSKKYPPKVLLAKRYMENKQAKR